MLGMVLLAMDGKRLRGASTITQQLAKNLWLTPMRSPLRKIREAVLTRQLGSHLSKQRIPELYLNVVQFRPEICGIGATSRRYFGIPASELDSQQAAALAAALPRPSNWYPGADSRGYRRAIDRIRMRVIESPTTSVVMSGDRSCEVHHRETTSSAATLGRGPGAIHRADPQQPAGRRWSPLDFRPDEDDLGSQRCQDCEQRCREEFKSCDPFSSSSS
jgi:monofunctional biosynthetic peptidoglycan transglycosylase